MKKYYTFEFNGRALGGGATVVAPNESRARVLLTKHMEETGMGWAIPTISLESEEEVPEYSHIVEYSDGDY
jgi:hypothetical protein